MSAVASCALSWIGVIGEAMHTVSGKTVLSLQPGDTTQRYVEQLHCLPVAAGRSQKISKWTCGGLRCPKLFATPSLVSGTQD